MKTRLTIASFLLGSALMLIPFTGFLRTSASDSISRAVAPGLARLSDRATVHAEGRAGPRINLADGREVLTAYTGEPEAQRLLQQNLVQPVAMASSDFDGDGIADLVTGYAAPNGGMLTLHRGNADAIYPHTLEAQQRGAGGAFTDAPFLSPARAFETPRPVDFIGAGDFDADGHLDVVTAARGGSSLYFFLGDGRGDLSAPRQVDLPGRVTALVTGEINRADGLADLAVGVTGTDGPQVLVFEAPDGALRANPEVFPLPAEASALALGQFDDDAPMDLAAASGRELMIVRGQALRPSLGKTNRANAVIDRRSFSFAIRSLAIGDFSGNQRDDLGLLSDVGAVHVLSRPKAVSRQSAQKSLRVQKWQDKTLPGAWPQARLLDRARVSSLPTDNLIVIDSTNARLQILASEPASRKGIQASTIGESLDVEGEPVAVLPMRLNADALSDLVILRSRQVSPSMVITAPAVTFTVSNTNDSGAGSLRAAILNANSMPGADLITFDIGVGGPQTITLVGLMDSITEAVTIDGTTQPGFAGNPIIEMVSLGVGPGDHGLTLSAGGTTIRGLVINNAGDSGISISGSGNNIVERNFIGTNITGNAADANGGSGVTIDGTSNNRVGGSTAAASNLISGNSGAGVEIINGALNNLVLGNFIGTNVSGSSALGNGNFGVAVLLVSSNNSIGGTTPGAGNLISGNTNSGVVLAGNGTNGNLVQNNLIGTISTGTSPLPNNADGVSITSGAANNTIGGTVAAARNIIAFNIGDGVTVASGSGNSMLGNSIFSNSFGIDINDDLGVTPNDACDVDPGPNGLQNFPVLTSATNNGGTTTVIGTLNSNPGVTFRIEFFSNNTCDPSGFGQGRTFLGSTSIMTGVSCTGPINVVLPTAVAAGQVITAIATNAANDSSEFSQCVTVVAAMGPVSDLQITKSGSPAPVLSGANITYTIGITNNGPDTDAAVTFSDVIPAGTTFVSLTSPGSCSAPSPGGTGSVNCSLGALISGGSAAISLVVNVNAPPGATITNTATVSGMSNDSNPVNNSATANTVVTSGTCSLTCPPNLLRATSPTATSCGTVVTFAPATSGGCTPTCNPPSGSVFAVGTTSVTCTAAGAPSCSFSVTVVDETPPRITCSTGVTALLPPGQLSAVVNYPAPSATDNCTATSVVCAPPSGSTFPAGATLVTCTARDAFENANRCFFFVTVLDAQPPVITCPANVSAALPAGQTSTVVTYPPPTVTDNLPGVTVGCVPASGSTFPAGATVVTCTATDAGGNKASCSFTVGVGGPQAKVTIPGNKTSLEFAADPTRKPPKPKNSPCSLFTIQNVGFSPLVLTLESLRRTGTNVTNGRISDPNDLIGVAEIARRFFVLNVVNSDQSIITGLGPGSILTFQPGEAKTLCLRFAPFIPGLAGKTTGLAASDVLPDTLTSTISFRQNVGANIEVPILARVGTGVVLVNANNPSKPPVVNFTRSGNDITVTYAVFDSNLDVSRAKYEFLNSNGQVVGAPFEIDLAASISSANLLRGQSFRVEQKFTGASSNPEITGVRLTVFDGETSAGAPSTSSATSTVTSVQLMKRTRGVTLYLPDVMLR